MSTISSTYLSDIELELNSGNLALTQDNDTIVFVEDELQNLYDILRQYSENIDIVFKIDLGCYQIDNIGSTRFVEIHTPSCEVRVTFHHDSVTEFCNELLNMGLVK